MSTQVIDRENPSIAENERVQGIYVRFSFLKSRCRKPISLGVAGFNLDECFARVVESNKGTKGKFLSGIASSCSLYWVNFDGKVIWMQSMPIFTPGQRLTDEQINYINSSIIIN